MLRQLFCRAAEDSRNADEPEGIMSQNHRASLRAHVACVSVCFYHTVAFDYTNLFSYPVTARLQSPREQNGQA